MSLLLHIQFNWDGLMIAKDNNVLNYFIYDNDEEYLLGNKGYNIEKD